MAIPAFIPVPLLLGAAAFAAIAYLVLLFSGGRNDALRDAVETYAAETDEPLRKDAIDGSFWDRILGPVVGILTGVLSSTAPQEIRGKAVEKLAMAGNPLDVSTFLALKLISFLGIPLAYVAAVLLSGQRLGLLQLGTIGVAILVGRMLPDVLLGIVIGGRQKTIERGIPDAVDLIVACVEAGLSLDAALMRVAERMPGPLADEVARALHEMRLGRQRRDALKEMATRTGVASLRSLSQTVAHAEQMGVAIADALRVLAEDMRTKRRLKAQEMAQKAPLKMIPVIVFFILPSLFVVILGPAAISVFRLFNS
ncbi:MAG: type II secretion system F family protein [Chloroflexi bacterium]|nr:type II secretion system F family protein [Chloroflexota bacterium]